MSERNTIKVNERYSIDQRDLKEDFIRASGPGGQNVNKVSSSVQLRFNLDGNATLPDDLKDRLRKLAGSRLTLKGEIILTADRFRTQERNRDDALERLLELIRKAAFVPKARKATRPTLASKRRRIECKKQRGNVKKMRNSKNYD
ncbi:alternative ribosome rescue aminoacyl-tRNA hydrolase ArfB [Pseudovibrio sp. Tun.PSC04-5.I4]|uniref:alternative ribosome rescue aminoacyl-tRNA hydrolase ArfB n=1 Tax=Pseudovibrio sp. Tun.PSC04-5.I4 TaxID=1798213 RepID=UPI00088408FD|nr:alternative ribosome rescue aminoacyl-tRNA hydrolase ArfB [Pseudovibrio sp. Tun.PSC04-5.I4]SDR05157.1 ribosome-associated protein [Pseudovibrio sp. Tun.PSC04-5.I4]